MLEFETVKVLTAHKAHKCSLCSRKIEAGESYIRRACKFEGDLFDECYHSACWTILNAYASSDYCLEDYWEPASVREWLVDTNCLECMGGKENLDDCEVPIFRCRKIIEKLTGKDGDAV